MSYIGTPPSNAFTSLLKQDFSTSATTGYTLDHAVNNANDIALFINFVRQEPTAGYAASGTSLVLTSATASSDDMYCVYLGQALQTVNPPNASVGSDQTAPTIITGQTALTSVASDDTVLISDTSASGALKKMTRANFVSGIGGTNTPCFRAHNNSNQILANGSDVTVRFNQEDFDPQSTFNVSDYKFQPAVSGKYFLYANVKLSAANDQGVFELYMRKNSSTIASITHRASGTGSFSLQISNVVVSDTNDEFYIQAYQATGGNINASGGDTATYFTGYKIIE